LGGFAAKGRGWNFRAFGTGSLQAGATAAAGAGKGHRLRGGGAGVFFGLLNHRHELAMVVFLPRGLAGDEDLFLFFSPALSCARPCLISARRAWRWASPSARAAAADRARPLPVCGWNGGDGNNRSARA
jgi:hypothetical protein